jgi:hypothetical protein
MSKQQYRATSEHEGLWYDADSVRIDMAGLLHLAEETCMTSAGRWHS